jgi:hypothetical protein
MSKYYEFSIVKLIFGFFLSAFVLFNHSVGFSVFLAFFTILLSFINVWRVRNNWGALFIYAVIAYTNYSICMANYISPIEGDFFTSWSGEEISILAMSVLYVFNVFLTVLIYDEDSIENTKLNFFEENKENEVITFGICILLILIFVFGYSSANEGEARGAMSTYYEYSIILFILWIMLLSGDFVHYFIKRPITKKELKRQLKRNIITQEQYAVKRLKAVTAVPKGYDIYDKFTEKIEPVLYSAIPFILICLGSKQAALITSFFLIFLVMAQEIGLEKSISKKFDLLIKIPLGVIALLIFLIQVVFSIDFGIIGTLLMYTFGYELMTMVWLGPKTIRLFNKEIRRSGESYTAKERFKLFINKNKTVITVHGYFTACIILTTIFMI